MLPKKLKFIFSLVILKLPLEFGKDFSTVKYTRWQNEKSSIKIFSNRAWIIYIESTWRRSEALAFYDEKTFNLNT